jgi:anti-anti-sigma factor
VDQPVQPGAVEVTWSGHIDAAAVSSGAVQAVLPKEGKPNVVLNCSKVTFIDSTGLGLLIKTYRTCKQAGGTLVVLNPSEAVERMLTLMYLARLIPIAHDIAEVPRFLPVSTGVSQATTSITLTLALTGDITAATVESLEAQLRNQWEQAPVATRLQLDLAQVSFMDSSGLGFLLRALKLARKRPGGTLKLLNPSPNVSNVIKLANLQLLFGVSIS